MGDAAMAEIEDIAATLPDRGDIIKIDGKQWTIMDICILFVEAEHRREWAEADELEGLDRDD